MAKPIYIEPKGHVLILGEDKACETRVTIIILRRALHNC